MQEGGDFDNFEGGDVLAANMRDDLEADMVD